MNVRVALLLGMSALYVRIWAGDQAYQRARTEATVGNQKQSALRDGNNHRDFSESQFQATPIFEISRRSVRRNMAATSDEIPMNSLWMFGNCELPIPAGIAPGAYRVVSSNGEVRKVELAEDELEYHGVAAGAPARELYTVLEGRTRWYFVRIESKPSRLWMTAAKPDWRALFRGNAAKVSDDVSPGSLAETIAEIGRRIGTAGAQLSTSDELLRRWTQQRWLELRQQWNALLRQARWAKLERPKQIIIPLRSVATPSRLSADSVKGGLR